VDTTVITRADTSVGPSDTVFVTSFDTVFAPSDTVLITSFDTVFSPPDTVLITTVDTVVSGTDTTFVTTVDTLLTVDTVVVVRTDTLVSVDTIVVTTVDTVVTVDTVIVVDTVYTSNTLVASVSTLNLKVGQTATLSVTSQNPLGFPTIPTSVTWLSSAPGIASVDATGRVRGQSPGQTSVFALASGLSVSVPTTVVDSATNPPPPPPPAFGVLFDSDWSTATGTSRQALLDLSQEQPWDAEKGNGDGGAAVTDTVPWPDGIANALTISHISGNDNPGVRLVGSLPSFTSGARAYRFYLKNVLPDNHAMGDNSVHPFQDGAGGSNTNWEFNIRDLGNGTWTPAFELTNGTCAGCGGIQYQNWTLAAGCMEGAACAVPKDSVYRFEFKLTHHPTAEMMDIEIRMYNANGTLRAGPAAWKRVNGGGTSADTVWYTIPNPATMRDLLIGVNGWGGGTTSSRYVAWHWAGVAICSDWCGAYRP
jgi:hypothetical protein